MSAVAKRAVPAEVPTSCGTLIINPKGQILLCHVTNANNWDIPKGTRDPGEENFAAAMRELQEEAGITFPPEMFRELGGFEYGANKRLHLYMVHAPASLDNLDHLVCTSHFRCFKTGQMIPEMDGFCWANRADVKKLCKPRMARMLLSFDW